MAMPLQYVCSTKFNPKLLIDGYLYIKDKGKEDGKVYWKCEINKSQKCRARAVTNGDSILSLNDEHNHKSDSSRIEALKAMEAIRQRAIDTLDAADVIIKDMRSVISESAAKHLSTDQTIKNIIRRIRHRQGKKSTSHASNEIIRCHDNEDECPLEPNMDDLLKILEDAISMKMLDGGVYLSANYVKTIETFIQKQNSEELINDRLEDDIKLEIFHNIYEPGSGIDEDDNKDEEDDGEQSICKRNSLELSIEDETLELLEKQNTKRLKISESVLDSEEHVINSNITEIGQTKHDQEMETETVSEQMSLLQVLNEIITSKIKSKTDNLYYVPCNTVKLIESYLKSHNTLICESEL